MIKHYSYNDETIVTINYFCEDILPKGTIVSLKSEESVQKHKINTIAFGISLCDVVNKDLTKVRLLSYNDEVQQYSKIRIMRRGELRIYVPDEIVKIGSKIYTNHETAAFSAYKNRFAKLVGRALSNSDDDGFVKIEFDFTRVGA